MFYLCGVEDKVRVNPADLGRPVLEAVTSVIEQLYINKARHCLFEVTCPLLRVDKPNPSEAC